MKLPLVFIAMALPLCAATAAPQEKGAVPSATPKAERTPSKTTVIDPAKLRALLPEPPEGWKAERAETQKTGEEDEIHISTARRSYYTGNGEDDPVAAITIIDSTNNADYFDADEEGQWEMEAKSEEGYDKRLLLDGMKVIEHYSEQAKTGSLSIFVGNRYFVQIELTNDDPVKLYDWLKRLDLKALAALR